MSQCKIIDNYRDNHIYRNEFFKFICRIFPGADFKTWYSKGFWTDEYIPYSILEQNRIISNVSISKMKIIINGKMLPAIQFATVGTLKEYRNSGLSRYLMEYVLNKYTNSTEIFFMFANDRVLNFYQKFGFKQFTETIFISNSKLHQPNYSAKKINIHSPKDMELLKTSFQKRIVLTKLFGAVDFEFAFFWHIFNTFPNDIFYVEEKDVIVIATFANNCLHLFDVIFNKPISDINLLIPKIVNNKNIKSVYYYFPPEQLGFEYDEVKTYEDSPLFIRGEFALKDKYFKFPVTAQT